MRGWRVELGAAAVALLGAVVVGGVIPDRATTALPGASLAAAISTPVKVHGLLAAQTLVISNPGTVDARRVQAHFRLAPGLVLERFVSPQGTCVKSSVSVDCTLGTLPAGHTITFHPRYRLGYVAPKTDNGLRVTAVNAAAAVAAGPSYFLDRYWLCGCATAYTYPNGWIVPETDRGVTVSPDDTVRLLDNYYISPDGVLHFPDGRMIKETLTAQQFIPARHSTGKSK